MMLHLIRPAVITSLIMSVNAQSADSKLTERAYVYLKNQNLATLGTVLSVLLVLMFIMAVCVYKPLSRR